MLISIVTPAFRAERHLAETIESVMAQTYRHWEYLIVDDGSPDRTTTIAAAYIGKDTRIRLHRQNNAGVSAARNAGYRLISNSAQCVVFLDADDVWRPSCLELLVAKLGSEPGAPAVHGRAACIDGDGKPIALEGFERFGRRYLRGDRAIPRSTDVTRLPDDEPTSFSALAFVNPITTPGQVLIRRRALDELSARHSGEALFSGAYAEDWDLWLRLGLQLAIAYLPEIIIDYRRHSNNASVDLAKMRQGDLRVRHKIIALSRGEQQRIARASLRYVELSRCHERLCLARDQLAALHGASALRDVVRASRSLVEVAASLVVRR